MHEDEDELAAAPVDGDCDPDGAEDPQEGKRYRHWVFTQHNYTDEECDYVFSMRDVHGASYVCCGREVCPDTGTPHLQGVVSFPTMKSWKQLREILPDAYWRAKVTRSTFKQWSDYTKKEDQHPYEEGTLPADPLEKGERGAAHWAEQIKCVEEGRYEDLHPQARALHLKSLEYAVAATAERKIPAACALDGHASTPNEWHWGVPGCGKSEHAGADTQYEHDITNPWWTDYKGGNVFVDEVTVTQGRKFAHVLKKLGHHRKMVVQRKYMGQASIRPPRVFVTSQANPACIFKGDDWIAIKRRYKIYYWGEPFFIGANPDNPRNPKWYNPTLGGPHPQPDHGELQEEMTLVEDSDY